MTRKPASGGRGAEPWLLRRGEGQQPGATRVGDKSKASGRGPRHAGSGQSQTSAFGRTDKADKLLRRLIMMTRRKPTNSTGAEGHVQGDSRGCFMPVNLKIEMKWIILGKIRPIRTDTR